MGEDAEGLRNVHDWQLPQNHHFRRKMKNWEDAFGFDD